MITINMVSHLFMRLRMYNGPAHSLSFTRTHTFFTLLLCLLTFRARLDIAGAAVVVVFPSSMQLGIFYFMYNMCMHENEKVMRFNDNLLHGSVYAR